MRARKIKIKPLCQARRKYLEQKRLVWREYCCARNVSGATIFSAKTIQTTQKRRITYNYQILPATDGHIINRTGPNLWLNWPTSTGSAWRPPSPTARWSPPWAKAAWWSWRWSPRWWVPLRNRSDGETVRPFSEYWGKKIIKKRRNKWWWQLLKTKNLIFFFQHVVSFFVAYFLHL